MILEYVKKKKKPTQRQYVKGTVMQAIFFDIVLPTEHKGEVTSFVPLLFLPLVRRISPQSHM